MSLCLSTGMPTEGAMCSLNSLTVSYKPWVTNTWAKADRKQKCGAENKFLPENQQCRFCSGSLVFSPSLLCLNFAPPWCFCRKHEKKRHFWNIKVNNNVDISFYIKEQLIKSLGVLFDTMLDGGREEPVPAKKPFNIELFRQYIFI